MLERQDIIKYLSENKQFFREKYFVDKIGLIGSYARNDYDQNSDIDLVIYFLPEANNNRIFRLYIDLQEKISSQLKKQVDIIANGKVLPAFKEMINNEIIYV
ncbi:MAG: nucleotidyltransferase domain-containing protein [Bacteroidales bacterium]|nr:nucleotidyltransferase domain-containing protein [Bacteroidales bacterium]